MKNLKNLPRKLTKGDLKKFLAEMVLFCLNQCVLQDNANFLIGDVITVTVALPYIPIRFKIQSGSKEK
ncbi:hypothetical protein EG345_05895 [Chryseobacterium carnipullorum]|uniref:hypothetical protein n=1 Tax=Chryseobacterium carnipullorum TaxID=1124835 RepID=UPI000F4DF48F|nr:hypothetical protein [Chryseobacterium carnipullorum]AZA64286.1 hypothetical protein EG345_05895 [Chryseobacterium carnipullorum]